MYNQENITLAQRLREAKSFRETRRAQRKLWRERIRDGKYTNGDEMTKEDRKLYHYLSVAAVVTLVFIAILIGAIIAVAVI